MRDSHEFLVSIYSGLKKATIFVLKIWIEENEGGSSVSGRIGLAVDRLRQQGADPGAHPRLAVEALHGQSAGQQAEGGRGVPRQVGAEGCKLAFPLLLKAIP